MKCCAPVTGRALSWRADRTTDGHCHRRGIWKVAGKRFCYQHVHEWRTHYALVERIRAIPNRDILEKSKMDYDG
jgi:hypothetical protein